MLSRKADYALRAVTYITLNPEQRVPTRVIAERLRVPYKFLTQILLELVRKGILQSQRGSRGGISLRKKPEEITLLDIIEAVEGPFTLHECLSEEGESCFFTVACPIKEELSEIEQRTREVLSSVTLDKIKKNYLRRSEHENY